MIIDHHNHIWEGRATGEGFLDLPMSANAILKAMDADGVDLAGVCTLAQDIQNDYVLAAQRAHPDRLFGYCFINPREPGGAETLRRYLGEGLKGLKLHPRLHGFPLRALPLVGPLLQVCQEYKVPAFSHGNGSEEFNVPSYFEELARAFPDVPIIIGHMGSFNAVDDAILVANRTPNVYLDTSLASWDNLMNAVRTGPIDRIMMSSDWPGSPFRLEQMKVELATPNDLVVRRKLMGENYARLVGMPAGLAEAAHG